MSLGLQSCKSGKCDVIYSLLGLSKLMSGLLRVSIVDETVYLAFNPEFFSSVWWGYPSCTVHLSRTETH